MGHSIGGGGGPASGGVSSQRSPVRAPQPAVSCRAIAPEAASAAKARRRFHKRRRAAFKAKNPTTEQYATGARASRLNDASRQSIRVSIWRNWSFSGAPRPVDTVASYRYEVT